MATLGELVVNLKAETAQFTRAMQGVRAEVKGTNDRLTSMGTSLKSAAAGFLTFQAAEQSLRAVVAATMEAEQATARLGAVIKATGAAAGLTAGDIDDLATAMQRNTLFDDEDVKNAAAALATFSNVTRDTFREAISLGADLTSVFGGDLQGNVVKLGKALDQPLEGIDALSKMGVRFNDTEKEIIKSLLEHNNLAEAQAAVLDKVRGKVAGAAEAMGGQTGLTGEVNKLSDAWKDLLEAMGAGAERRGTLAFGLANTMRGTARELRFIESIFEEVDPHSMEALTAELEKQKKILTATNDQGFWGSGAGDASREKERRRVQSRIDAIRAEMQALDDAEEHRTAGEARGNRPGAPEETPEHRAKRLADEKRAREDAERARTKDLANAYSQASDALSQFNDEQREAQKQYERTADAATDAVQAQLDYWQALADADDAAWRRRLMAEADNAREDVEIWNNAIRDIQQEWAGAFTDLLTGQITTFREFAAEILSIWANTMAQMASANLAGDIFGGLFRGSLTLPSGGPMPFPGLPSAPLSAPVNITVNVPGTNATPAQITGAVLAALRGRGLSSSLAQRTS